MQAVLLNDTDGRKNIGCRLTSSLLKEHVERHFRAADDAFALTAFPWHFGHHSARRRTWGAALGWMASGGRPGSTRAFGAWLAELARQEYGREAVEAALRADVVIFQPEGSISTSDGAAEILNLLSLPLLACTRRVPVFVMNGTFPLYTDRRFKLIKTFLDLCCHTALRDRPSAGHYGARFMPDTAVLWPDTARAGDGDESSPSYALITTGAQCPKAMNIGLAVEALAFCEKVNLKPLVMSKQHAQLASLRRAIDRQGGRVVEAATLQQASKWLSQCRIHMGGRFHMALFCLAHRVPSVLVPVNTHKNRWLSEEFPGIELVDSVEKVGEAAGALYGQLTELAPQMTAALNGARSLVHEEMAYAASLAGKVRGREVTSEALTELQRQVHLVDALKQVLARPDIRWRRFTRRLRERSV